MEFLLTHLELYLITVIVGGIIGLYFFIIRRKIIKSEEKEAAQDNRLYLLEKKQAILEAKLVNKDDFFDFANQLRDSLTEKIDGYKKDHEDRLNEFLTIQDKKFQNLDFKIDSIRKDINRNN